MSPPTAPCDGGTPQPRCGGGRCRAGRVKGHSAPRLPDRGPEQAARDAARAREWLAQLAAIDEKSLAHEDSLWRDALRRTLEAVAEGSRYHWFGFEVMPYSSSLPQLTQMLAALRLDTPDDGIRYVALAKQVPEFVNGMRTRLAQQAERGIRVPKDALGVAVPFLRGLAKPGTQSPFVPAPSRTSRWSPEADTGFRRALASVIDDEVAPALESLAAWLDRDYRAAAPDVVGLDQYPGGPEYYRFLVRLHTTLEADPEEIHRIGLELVARIEREMAAIRAQVGFSGTKAEFKQALRTNPRFFPRTPDEIAERFMTHIRRIEPKVDAYFLTKPRAPYGVKRLDPELEAGQTFGFYQMPTPADPVGYYRFNGSNLQDRSLLNAAGLIFHELVPGHHFQIGLAREMGMYEDPYDRYGRLAMDMFISTRLVVDTGMNALGWSRARAVAFMREHLTETDTQIETESIRYSCDIPAQALAYRMGALKIRELRDRAQRALGARFDIRRFHDAVLGSGSLPMTTLERHIDWFIARER